MRKFGKKADPAIPIPPGTERAALIVYDSGRPAYEVEFGDDAGRSLGAYSVGEKNLQEIK
jgi:hypothetical protein